MMTNAILNLSLFFLMLSLLATIFRIIKGPTTLERVQALDVLGIYLIGGVAIFSVRLRSVAFFEVILLLGILSFIVTIAFARYFETGGVVVEPERSD